MFQHFIIHMCKHFDSNDNTSVLFTNIFKPLNILDPFMFGVTYVWVVQVDRDRERLRASSWCFQISSGHGLAPRLGGLEKCGGIFRGTVPLASH